VAGRNIPAGHQPYKNYSFLCFGLTAYGISDFLKSTFPFFKILFFAVALLLDEFEVIDEVM
jgi:hypothetical protein